MNNKEQQLLNSLLIQLDRLSKINEKTTYDLRCIEHKVMCTTALLLQLQQVSIDLLQHISPQNKELLQKRIERLTKQLLLAGQTVSIKNNISPRLN